MSKLLFSVAALAAIGVAAPASAAVTVCSGGGCAPQPHSNVQVTGGQTGSTVSGTLNNAPGTVEFTSAQSLATQGQRVAAATGGLTDPLDISFTGGLSRSYTRTYAPGRYFRFEGFSPFTRPNVIEQAEGIPFTALTGYDVGKLYQLKGDIVRRGVKVLTGFEMPIFPKRRFQHGALRVDHLRQRLSGREADYRKQFLGLYN